MKFRNLVVAGILALASAAQAATTGSCYSSAASLKGSQTVRLVAEYDKEMYEGYDDSGAGVYYAKIKLSKGQAYTIWISGGNTANVDIDVDINYDAYGDNDNYPTAQFDVTEYNSGSTKAATLYASDWDEEDPGSAVYYVTLSGDLGDTVNLYYQTGIRAFVLDGEESNPVTLTMKDTAQSKSSKCIEGEYWFKSKLTAGRLYKVTTAKGSVDAGGLGITMDGNCPFFAVPDFTDEYNDSQFFEPETTANYKFYVDGEASQAFTLKYQAIPQLAIAKHTLSGELTAENDYVVAVTPGALHASYDYWDQISDSALVKVSLTKGERWVFETTGATSPIELRVYNSSGAVLASNDTVGNLNLDCRAAITASATGVYYVGLFDTNLDVGEAATSGSVTITGRNCKDIAAADSYDPIDDTYGNANQIYAANAVAGANIYEVGSSHGVHAFNGGDWYDYFALPCRNGVTYELRAEFADEESASTLTLAAEVFYISDGKKVTVKTAGDLTPMGYVQEEVGALKFTAAKNLTYYIGVHVKEGVGLDYPAFNLRTMAYRADGTALGLLQVKTKGADGAWYLNSEKLYYKNGAMVNISATAVPKIVFKAVTGFATPATQTVTMKAAETEADAVVVTGVYNDSFDKYVKDKKTVTDDNTTGAVTITGKSTAQTAKRTLWTNDPQDMFLFKAAAGVYYNFKLVDTTLDGTGDAQFAITQGTTTEVIPATTSVSKQLFAAGNHYLTVKHADSANPVDTSYTLEYSAFNAGTIKFSAANYTVKESSATAKLVLKRSAKEGRLRVNFATVQGSSTNELENAMPGKEYYPTNGIIEWAHGDMKDKTITVRLIPDLVALRESNKSFSVKIWAMDEDDIEEDEYPSQITLDTAKVTITEVTAAKAGTVSISAYGDDDTAIANVKKPAFAVTAGEDAIMTFSRKGGVNGRLAVKVTAAKGKTDTARAGVDFETASEVLVWEDGDASDKTFTVTTLASSDLTASRKFTVSMAAQTTGAYAGYSKPTLSASTASVTIKNDTYVTPFSKVQSAAKTAGVTLSSKGTWFVDADGNFRSSASASASVTFQVTGPGVFIASPTAGCGNLSCRIGSGEVFYPDGEFARAVPAGKQNIVFSFTEGDGSSYPEFAPLDEETGAVYRWVPFSKFDAYEPFSKCVNQPGVTTNLSWTVPAELVGVPMYYRVRHGLATTSVKDELGWTAGSSLDVDAALTAEPSKAHYWALDFAVGPDKSVTNAADLAWTAGNKTWTFSTSAAGTVTTEASVVDAYGESYYDEDGKVAMETIHLVKDVAVNFEIGPAGLIDQTVSATNRIYSGALPTGLKLDPRGGKGVVSGIPTVAGTFTTVLQTASGTAKSPKWGSTITLRFEVEDTGTAVGSFFGTLTQDGQAVDRAAPSVGSIALTTAANGKNSAKVIIAGLAYTFSGTGFKEILSSEETETGMNRTLQAELTCVKKYSKVAYTNVLTVTMLDAPADDLVALGSAAASVTLEMNVPNAAQTTATEGVVYIADLYRTNTANADYLAALAEFEGYYTMALVAEDVEADDGLPTGNGFLTVKITNKGVATVTGRKADGKTLSFSGKAALIGNPEDPSSCQVYVPFAATSSTDCLGGTLQIIPDETAPYIESATTRLVWGRDGAGSTEDASGFLLPVVPVGGWFNTTDNLQRYYLDYDFTIDGTPLTLNSNAVSLGATKGETVSAMTYKLNRTTGITSGTLTSYSTILGKNVAKCPHYGILTFTRDSESPLAADVWTAGFFLRTATSTWKESIPFNILATEVDRDWSEATLPAGDAE